MANQIAIDIRQESYQPFFRDDFTSNALGISKNISGLDEIVFDLVADWRGASYSGALVAAIPASLTAYHNAREAKSDLSGIFKFADAILRRLRTHLYKFNLKEGLYQLIHDELVSISKDIVTANNSIDLTVQSQFLWDQYSQESAFRLGIHSTMRLVFVSVVAAYESFFVRSTRLMINEPVRVNADKPNEKYRRAFPHLVNSVWHQDKIHVAREIRNALVHNGGRLSDKLKQWHTPLPITIVGDEICIWPEHIFELYETLRDAAWSIIQDMAGKLPNLEHAKLQEEVDTVFEEG